MKIEVSVGEVFDKISILEIKSEKISDPIKSSYVHNELQVLQNTINEYSIEIPVELYTKLKEVNLKLWETEDIIREREASQNFDEVFIDHARLDAKWLYTAN